MPFRIPRRNSRTLTGSYASNAGTSTSSHPSRKVLVNDKELLDRVHEIDSIAALKNALTDPVNSWDSTKHTSCIRLGSGCGRDTFELSTRALGANKKDYEVLAVGCIACSPQELASILSPRDESEYNSAMKGLYGRKFIYGSVVQTSNANQSKSLLPDGHQLAVKTGCFARSRMLARNEQWCFLEYFQPTSDTGTDTSQGFSVSFLSLSEQEVAAGKAAGGRVDQIDGITALVVVDTVPAVSKDVRDGKSTKVRVMFRAVYNGGNKSVAGHASDKMARARLVSLAEGIPHLASAVRRRRLGMQVFAKNSVAVPVLKAGTQNLRCISCTKGIHLSALMRSARRCQLCAYNVCTACWSRQNIEMNNGHVVPMGVCNRCLEWVDRCDYSSVQVDQWGPVKIVDDSELSETSWMGQSLRDDLASESTKEAAVAVIQMLLSYSKTTDNAMHNTDDDWTSDEADSEEDYMSAVEEYFRRRRSEAPAAEDCVLANAQHRTYPLHPMDPGCPSAPVPENEAVRLEYINRFGLMDIKDPMPELDIICSFLQKELGCLGALVMIVGANHQRALSGTIRDFVHAPLPRDHSFCQHLLMGDAPLIVRNAEADIRFYNLDPVALQGIKYYCGVPVMGPENVVIGSVCCVHTSVINITRSQYDTLVRFGEIASKIIRVKAEANLSGL